MSRLIGNYGELRATAPDALSGEQRITSRLRGCSSPRDLEAVHAAAVKEDAHQDSSFAHQFVAACARFRRMDYALAVFRRMDDPGVFVYNAALRGFVLCALPARALELYVRMRRLPRSPTSHTFTAILRACTQVPAAGFAMAVHGQIRKVGFCSHVFVRTALIDFYAGSGKIDQARTLFDEMTVRDAVCWTAMMSAHAQAGDLRSARNLFDEMPERSTVSWNALIAGYARSGDAESAASLFERMPGKDLVSWTIMVSCYSQSKRFKEALETFEDMRCADVSPDEVTMAAVVSACAHLGALDIGRKAHLLVVQNGFDLDVYIGSALVDMYAKCGCLERSLNIFFKLKRKNLFCWNSAIEGLAVHGRGVDALHLFRLMRKEEDVKPNNVTFVSVLSACNHSGLVKEGREMFLSMSRDFSIEPEIKHYGCMVDLLGRSGHLQEALDMIHSMKMEPNSVIWGALLSGCKTHENMQIGEAAMQQLRALEKEDSGYFAMSVSIYARANRWSQVAGIRGQMRDQGVQKRSPGSSWIELDREVHEFAASDMSHTMSGDILAILAHLNGQLKRAYSLSGIEIDDLQSCMLL